MSWIDSIKHLTSAEVAERFGYELKRGPSASSCRCPACGAERRHTKSHDRRGAAGLPHATGGWACFQCDATGDAIDFAAYVLCDARFRDLSTEAKDQVRDWFVGTVGVDLSVPVKREKRVALPACFENAEAEYLPVAEIEDFWDVCCADAYDDPQVRAYMESRQIAEGVENFAHTGVARALAPGAVPAWAAMAPGRTWVDTGHRLIVPLYDHAGVARSVIARSVEASPRIKSSGPAAARRGLVMAGPVAQMVLRLGPAGRFHEKRRLQVLVHEGEIDFLRAVQSDRVEATAAGIDYLVAVFGIQAGSWQRDIAARIPSGSMVHIRTHNDEQGAKYAEQITESLGKRVKVEVQLVENT